MPWARYPIHQLLKYCHIVFIILSLSPQPQLSLHIRLHICSSGLFDNELQISHPHLKCWLLWGPAAWMIIQVLQAISLEPNVWGVHVFLKRKMNINTCNKSYFLESKVGGISVFLFFFLLFLWSGFKVIQKLSLQVHDMGDRAQCLPGTSDFASCVLSRIK